MMKKGNKISLLAAVSVLTIALAGCGGAVSGFTEKTEKLAIGAGSGSGEVASLGKSTFKAEEFDDIAINVTAMLIEVVRSDNEFAEFELITDKAIDNKFTFKTAIKSRKLTVKVDEESKFGIIKPNNQKGERRLIISLPDKQYGKVAIQSDLGEISLSSVHANSTKVKVNAGSIILSGGSGKLELDAEVGDIKVDSVKLDHDLQANVSVGDIEIKLDEPPAAAELITKVDVGKVKLDLGQVSYKVDKGSEKTGSIGAKGPRLKATAAVGEVRISAK
ncbi:hypothetical protein EBB07_23085 [Paenibacillaceae bacterium]|nr:hypothetical protein EBB07_23085 [Paenibacillaceae bacterium]